MTESAAPSPVQLDTVRLGADYFQDPLAYFGRMREQGPVMPVVLPHGDRAWMVTRYPEVRAALADARLHKEWAGKLTSPDWVPDYCLGAPLARLEGEVAFGALLGRSPDLSLAADPATLRWRPSSLIHGLEALPVRIG